MPIIDCPKCDGLGGWNDIDGVWVECDECEGSGYVDDEPDDETE